MKAHYAFKEQVAMVDFTYNEGKLGNDPLAKVSLSGFAHFALSNSVCCFIGILDLLAHNM